MEYSKEETSHYQAFGNQSGVGLGPGFSDRAPVRAMIFKLFWAFFGLIFSVSTQNVFIFSFNVFAAFFI